MPEIQTVLLIFGISLLALMFIRRSIRKQKSLAAGKTSAAPAAKPRLPVEKQPMTQEQFNRSWKTLSYMMLLAGAGNLYVAYTAVGDAMQSTNATETAIRYGDAVFAIAAVVMSVIVFSRPRRRWVYVYLILTVIPIMFFMSTGHYTDALVHLFPLILVYFVVQPVWSFLKE